MCIRDRFNIFGVKQIYEIKKIDFLSLDNFIFNVLDFKLIKNKSNDSINISANLLIPVSYTHLDVYKRQMYNW